MATLGTWQRWVFKGTGPGSEIWQTSLATTMNTPPTNQAAVDSLLAGNVSAWSTWWTAVKALVYTSYAWTELDLYQYVGSGSSAQFVSQAPQTPVPGTYATNGTPIDTSLVVSLRTPNPSRSGRGRMYVPYHKSCLSTGMCGTGDNATIGTATKALFTALYNAGSGPVPSVVSRTHNSFENVSRVVTDNKPDVQRRRENRLIPSSTQVLSFP